MSDVIIDSKIFAIDSSTVGAMCDIIEGRWDFNVYAVRRDYVMNVSVDELFDYFVAKYPGINYRGFRGDMTVFWGDDFMISLRGILQETRVINKRYDDAINFSGRYDTVLNMLRDFDEAWKDWIVPAHHNVRMIVQGSHGLDAITLPIKTDRKFYPEIYPILDDPHQFIVDYLNSSANVLILLGPAGLGKSAFINEIVLTAKLPTEIVFDENVMRQDQLYTNFINRTLGENGGLMIMEDSDNVLTDRITEQNPTMSRILNLSDGIVNTAGAKFIFSANLNSKDKVDEALMRPGRCFDVVEFRNLTPVEAGIAADAIGIDLVENKKDYTVAELFTGKTNRKYTNRKVGF